MSNLDLYAAWRNRHDHNPRGTVADVLVLVAMFVLVWLMGCAQPMMLTKDGMTQEGFQKDRYDCEQRATAKVAQEGFAGNILLIDKEVKRCMKEYYGYHEVRGGQ